MIEIAGLCGSRIFFYFVDDSRWRCWTGYSVGSSVFRFVVGTDRINLVTARVRLSQVSPLYWSTLNHPVKCRAVYSIPVTLSRRRRTSRSRRTVCWSPIVSPDNIGKVVFDRSTPNIINKRKSAAWCLPTALRVNNSTYNDIAKNTIVWKLNNQNTGRTFFDFLFCLLKQKNKWLKENHAKL